MTFLGLLAKYWQPGQVKTRLAARYGDQTAADIHRALLATSLSRFGNEGDRRVLAFSPADKRGQFAALAASQWELQPQRDGDLGQRMQHVFHEAFGGGLEKDGLHKVVLLGADSPTLPLEHIRAAFAALDDVPIVIGPSRDGGYYLLGIHRDTMPPIFGDMPWGGPLVLEQTLSRLKSAGFRWRLLPEWYDIDTPEDVEHLHCELCGVADDSDLGPLKRMVASLMR